MLELLFAESDLVNLFLLFPFRSFLVHGPGDQLLFSLGNTRLTGDCLSLLLTLVIQFLEHLGCLLLLQIALFFHLPD